LQIKRGVYMKYTVFYKPDGTLVSVISEQTDTDNIKVGTFEVPDGNVIDSIDISGREPAAISHATPMGDMSKIHGELEAINKRIEDINHKRSEETAELRAGILANATLIASTAPNNIATEESDN
jgi:hypothetical protein